ncbi:uncharacterized protein LOC110766714 [Prunus avium]|uniref:Uncharacterized protein LOC110766714 n=1 Tax=Prunus avium TaxID=42229 RepID=A0A6P5TFI9_PRUAV|nr:uncharacterized protein LOC110766714 [Prunus avium]
MCPICGDESESVEHMLLLCHWVEPIWFGSYLNLWIDKISITTFDKWLLSFSSSLNGNSGDKDIMTSIGYICWYIWKMRCKTAIESHPPSPMVVICESHAACRSYLNAQASKNATCRTPVPVAQTPQFWSPPANGIVKINVDASWKPGHHKAGIGVILHDSSGVFAAGLACSIAADSVIEAETLAILEGCNFAIQHGHTRVVIESDSKEAISCLNRSIPRGRWQLYPILCSIRNSCSTFRDCNWSWVPRTANLAADHLAKLAMVNYSLVPCGYTLKSISKGDEGFVVEVGKMVGVQLELGFVIGEE